MADRRGLEALHAPAIGRETEEISQTNAFDAVPPCDCRVGWKSSGALRSNFLGVAALPDIPACPTVDTISFSDEFGLRGWETNMSRWIATLAASLVLTWPIAALGDPVLKSSDAAIRVGNVMPYTGELAAFGAIRRARAG